jgi:lysophospholipase
VISFDWRGQGGSERVTEKPTLLHVNNFILYRRDLNQFIQSIPESVGPLIVLASSMGGHMALRYAHDYPERIKAIVTLAPMIEIKTGAYPSFIATGLAKTLVFLGLGERFVFGFSEHEYSKCVAAYSPERDGNRERFLQRCEQLNKMPKLAVGGPSFAWLDAAFHSCKKLSRASYAKDISTPVLMIIPENDHLVSSEAQINLCKYIPKCEAKIYPDAHHDLLRETNDIIARVWQDFDEFVAKL